MNRRRYAPLVWFVLGFGIFMFTRMNKILPTIPVAMLIAPVFILRFTRTQPARRGILLTLVGFLLSIFVFSGSWDWSFSVSPYLLGRRRKRDLVLVSRFPAAPVEWALLEARLATMPGRGGGTQFAVLRQMSRDAQRWSRQPMIRFSEEYILLQIKTKTD